MSKLLLQVPVEHFYEGALTSSELDFQVLLKDSSTFEHDILEARIHGH
jgi:hypothetical protein